MSSFPEHVSPGSTYILSLSHFHLAPLSEGQRGRDNRTYFTLPLPLSVSVSQPTGTPSFPLCSLFVGPNERDAHGRSTRFERVHWLRLGLGKPVFGRSRRSVPRRGNASKRGHGNQLCHQQSTGPARPPRSEQNFRIKNLGRRREEEESCALASATTRRRSPQCSMLNTSAVALTGSTDDDGLESKSKSKLSRRPERTTAGRFASFSFTLTSPFSLNIFISLFPFVLVFLLLASCRTLASGMGGILTWMG
ncbi:hypothetical protein IWZ00DRAFT_191429 [Phyllosticta capitalensis]